MLNLSIITPSYLQFSVFFPISVIPHKQISVSFFQTFEALYTVIKSPLSFLFFSQELGVSAKKFFPHTVQVHNLRTLGQDTFQILEF